MEKNKNEKLIPMSEKETRNINGGYYPPTDEQQETATGGNPFLKDIICWNTKPLGV